MRFKILSVALCVGLLSGCASQVFTIDHSSVAPETPTVQTTSHFFVSGLAQSKTTDAATICGGTENIVKVESKQTVVNGLLSFVTFGIYTPIDTMVYCKAK